jgi:hypothetical protein
MGGRMAAASGAAIGNVAANIWNPHATVRPRVAELSICLAAATAGTFQIRRTTAIGATFGATITPDIDNDIQRSQTPTSGLLLYLAGFGTQPTVDASVLFQWNMPAAVGAGISLPLEISIPPSTGLAVVTGVAALFPISDISIAWREEN